MWTSFPESGDTVGVGPNELAQAVFEATCRFATNSAKLQAAGYTWFVAYWDNDRAHEAAEYLDERLPLELRTKLFQIEIEAATLLVIRDIDESAQSLYERARLQASSRLGSLRGGEGLGPFWRPWGEVGANEQPTN